MISGAWQLTGSGIAGWAKRADSAAPVWVELLADNEVMGIALADLPEPDGCGFWLQLPDGLLSDDADLKVRIANTEILLAQADASQAQDDARQELTGELTVDRGLHISGWVCDCDHVERKVPVAAVIDGHVVAETIAAERRYRPEQADGHGFSLEIPHEYADGRSHTVDILDDKKRQLPGSPFRIRTLAQNAACWLGNQKKIDKPLLGAVQGLLETMEERLPGVLSLSRYELWKKAFPAEAPQGRQRASYRLLGAADAGLLARQQGIELRRKDSNPDFYLLAAPGTHLHPAAIARLYSQMKERGAQAVYADSEDINGEPQFKPGWDSESFLAGDYLGVVMLAPQVVEQAQVSPTTPQEELRFRLIQAAGDNILHVPGIYSRDGLQDGARRQQAVQKWLDEHRPGAVLRESGVAWPLDRHPLVSIIIPTRDQAELLQRCLTSLERTDWPEIEIIIVDNDSADEDAQALMRSWSERPNVRIMQEPGVFNYAWMNNNAVRQAAGELVCFLNNDTEALHPEWLRELAAPLLAAGKSGGASGAKLLWPNGLVQHGGVIVGTHQLAAHVGNRWLHDEPGYMNRNRIAQQFSAVTAACMLTYRDLFLENGGFDARRFPVAFNDVDYCLRLRKQGKKIFWTPESRLAHHESASRGKDKLPSARARADREAAFFRKLWGHYEDPFYNPNLSLSAVCEPFHGLAFPPRPRETR